MRVLKKVFHPVLVLALLAQAAPLARAQETTAPRKVREQIRGVRAEGTRAARMNLAELQRQESLNPDDSYAVPRAIPAPKPAPEEPPGPEADALSASSPAVEADAPQPLGPSPSATGFLGSEDSVNDGFRSIPPDTHGAVGPNHLVVTHNGRVRVQTKTGQTLSTVGLKTFWSRLFPGKSLSEMDVFDPKVLYDPYGGRFMITSCADRNKPESAVLVGVTQTSDPTGNWFLYSADADPADLTWADFPSMGFNKNWIVVQMNMFAVGAGTSNAGKFFVFDKAQLYAGPSSIGVTGITVPTSGFTMVPAATYDPNLETLYVLQRWNGASGSLRVSAINNVGGIPTLATALSFPQAAGFTWQSTGASQADFAPQQGSVQKIQTNDDRMHGVVYRNGSLWGAHTVFTPRGAPTRSVIQWWEVDPSVTTGQFTAPRQRGLVDPSGTDFYAFPSIAVNRHNDVLVGYSRFGANQFAGANYSFRAGTDPSNSLRDDAVLKAGEAHYYKTFGGTENRWGDYSATTVDPSNDTDLWTLQEYAAARAGTGAARHRQPLGHVVGQGRLGHADGRGGVHRRGHERRGVRGQDRFDRAADGRGERRGECRLRDEQPDGERPQGLQRLARHAPLRRGRDGEDRHRLHHQRPLRRAERDFSGQAQQPGRLLAQHVHGSDREHHQRRRRERPEPRRLECELRPRLLRPPAVHRLPRARAGRRRPRLLVGWDNRLRRRRRLRRAAARQRLGGLLPLHRIPGDGLPRLPHAQGGLRQHPRRLGARPHRRVFARPAAHRRGRAGRHRRVAAAARSEQGGLRRRLRGARALHRRATLRPSATSTSSTGSTRTRAARSRRPSGTASSTLWRAAR